MNCKKEKKVYDPDLKMNDIAYLKAKNTKQQEKMKF